MSDKNTDWKAACMSWQKAAVDKDKALDAFEQRCVVLEKEVEKWKGMVAEKQAEAEQWKAEAERWRKARCGEAGEHSKPLSSWKNYDHTAEIEAVRDELARSQSVIAEKERELERMEMRSGIRSVPDDLGRSQEVTETVADLPEEEHPAITRMNKAVERAKQGTVFGVAEGVAALPTKDMIERLPKGYTFYGKGPLKHLSIVDDDEVAMWDSECSLWDISSAYEGSDVGEFYALKNGSQVAIANGVLSFPHDNPVKECADGLREAMENSVEEVQPASVPNVVINIYL